METLESQADYFMPDMLPEPDRIGLVEALGYASENSELVLSAPSQVQAAIMELGDQYLENGEYIQLGKLFKKAVRYVANGRVSHSDEGGFEVGGDNNSHQVTHDEHGSMACDCDLFNGRGQYVDDPGECSHLQTVTLFMLSESVEE